MKFSAFYVLSGGLLVELIHQLSALPEVAGLHFLLGAGAIFSAFLGAMFDACKE